MSRPVRVLELRSVRGTGGGPEVTILVSAALADPGRFAETVCYLRAPHDPRFGIGERAAALGIDYVEVMERHPLDPGVLTALRRLVRGRGIDVVHSHEYKSNLLALLLARTEGIGLLATAHGWTGHSRRERWAYYPLDKRVLRRFPRLVAVSSGIRRELVRCGIKEERIAILPNGIDADAFRRDPARRQEVRAALGLAPGDLVVGSVGRLEPQKRFDLLLAAFARLRGRFPRVRLLIAGEGSARPVLEAAMRDLGLDGGCRLLGHRDDAADLHHAFDLFVQSSDYEGTPYVVLEAMAMGTPVVATAAGGTGELIEDGIHGLLVPSGDARLLAEAMERALADRDATASRAAAARARVEGPLSFAARMRRVEAIYEELAASRRDVPERRTAPPGEMRSSP
jgi:glycosyltransferase involved in cell wall biosynthesis